MLPSGASQQSIYTPELLSVKTLFLQHQYRQCIQACCLIFNRGETSFTHPIQRSFLEFYGALAHDELARAIHNYSPTKISAFERAEQGYLTVLQNLPTLEQVRKIYPEVGRFPSRENSASSFNPVTPKTANGARSTDGSVRSLPMQSSICSSPGLGQGFSEEDELESHASFDLILTPGCLQRLARDFSSMSLIPPQEPQEPKKLLGPIRMGSPPLSYRASSKPASGTSEVLLRSPRKHIHALSPVPEKLQLKVYSKPKAGRAPPLSSLDLCEACQFSSNQIDHLPNQENDQRCQRTPRCKNEEQSITENDLDKQLFGMRSQVETLLKLLRQLKYQSIVLRDERDESKRRPNHSSLAGNIQRKPIPTYSTPGEHENMLPSTHSYWSFTPEDVKKREQQSRIQAGKVRGWARKRFDATRYIDLAQKALSEM